MKEWKFPGYTVTRRIVGGGMTDLFVAIAGGHRRVTIRYPKPEFAVDRKIRKAVAGAGEVLRKLDHPNVVKVVDTGTLHRVPFLVLEYIESRTLRDMVLHRDPFLTDNSLSLIRQIAAAVHYVHCSGYLHLDVKPENLLIQDDGHVVLIDFDLVTSIGSKSLKLKNLPGTPAYRAPETVAKQTVDERTDVYSVGVTCYELLTCHKPFETEKQDQALVAQLDPNVEPTPLRKHNPAVPAKLEAIILKCLAKVPDNRYPSMSLVVKDLESII